MATYVLIHGAGSNGWYWHLVAPELRARGHHVVAVDLPCDDDSAGLSEYAETVVDAIGDRRTDRTDLVLVAQSMAGFTAPLVCERVPVGLLVLVAAMVPLPGESPGEWWANTGHEQAQREQAEREGRTPGDDDLATLFLHDLPPELAAEAMTRGRAQSATPFEKPWPLEAWPEVATRFLLCRHDRFFPAAFMRRVVQERLGIVPDEMAGGHLPALSRPKELAERLEAYRTGQ
jgi:pimeloyl-ACP methyl ester carboxylesterase